MSLSGMNFQLAKLDQSCWGCKALCRAKFHQGRAQFRDLHCHGPLVHSLIAIPLQTNINLEYLPLVLFPVLFSVFEESVS